MEEIVVQDLMGLFYQVTVMEGSLRAQWHKQALLGGRRR